MSIAERVNKINPSFTLQMATKAAEMRSKGHRRYKLFSWGA